MFSTTEAEYIVLSEVMMSVLTFVSLMKEIELVLELQQDTLKVFGSLFRNPRMVHKYNLYCCLYLIEIKEYSEYIFPRLLG